MFKFRNENLQESLNTRSHRSRERLFGTVRVHILALVSAISFLMAAEVIHAQQLFVTSFNSNEVLRYDGTTGAFIDAFVTAGSGGLDLPSFLIFFEPSTGGGGGCSVASAGAPVSVPLYLFVPLLFVIVRRALRVLRG